MSFATIEEAIADFAAGRMVIVVDDEGRKNEGDFIMAAEKVHADAVNFMATNGRGLICMPVTASSVRLPPLTRPGPRDHRPQWRVSIPCATVQEDR